MAESLQARLIRMIRHTGPLSLADYMSLCLMDEAEGYYTRSEVFGAAGDFITAPEISQMFGELIGLALAQAWADQGAPQNAILVELGPGRGTLMRDARRAMARLVQMPVHFIEGSARLQALQAEHHPDACWHKSLDTLPQGPIFLIANEFFDALPMRQFHLINGSWRERVVALAGTGAEEHLAFTLSPAHALQDKGPVAELRPAAEALTEEIALRIAAHGGAAILIDYGAEEITSDTFQALRAHRYADPLAAPGKADLTSHVAFGPLARAAQKAGARPSALQSQGVFLESLGIAARTEALARKLEGAALTEHLAAHRRLCHPQEMGHLFKVLGITPIDAPPIAGLP